MVLYDITRTISPHTAVWPGDTSYSVAPQFELARGHSVNLTTITLSPHTGTHADAYYHYEPDGAHPAAMPLDSYLGRACVVSVARRDGPMTLDDFGGMDFNGVERVLVHSHVSDLPDDQWPAEFPYLSVDLIAHWAAAGVKLIGLDSPSMDALDSSALPCHHALKQYGIVNLELVCLRGVPDGDYELIALPLKMDLTCGSPVRAVLRSV